MTTAADLLADLNGAPSSGPAGAAGLLADLDAGPPQGPRKPLQAPQPMSWLEQMAAKVPSSVIDPMANSARGIVTKAAGTVMGGAQGLANILPDSTGVPQQYNKAINAKESAVKDSPWYSKVVGSAVDPANLAIALRAGSPITAGTRAIQGGGIGTFMGATEPTETGPSGSYWGPKAAQTAIAGVAGAAFAPLVGAIGDKIASWINRAAFNPANAAKDADTVITSALKDSGQAVADVPPDQLDHLRRQVVGALAKGQNLDPAAALRQSDFEREGIQPLRGWVTRDPAQWQAEQNVRGVVAAGEPVMSRIAEGNRAIAAGVGKFGANSAEAPVASSNLASALRSFDQGKQQEVSAAYSAARDSTGKDLPIPTDGLLASYKQVVSDFEDKVPKAIQSKFNQIGSQFSFEDADKLRKVINDHVGSDTTTNKALGRLRDSLNTAQTSADAAGGPFAPAVKLASQRFGMNDAIPAIPQAVNGAANDRFIQQQVINNPSTPEVQRLAAHLKENSPDQFQEVRAQIGAYLSRSAFGENVAGDKAVAQEGYNKALRTLGTGKLEAFFAPAEVEQMKRLGRLASYQVSPPAGSASNYSNTASAAANILRSLGSAGPFEAGKPLQFAGNRLEAWNAMNGTAPTTPNLTPGQRALLAKILAGGSGAVAPVAGGIVGQ